MNQFLAAAAAVCKVNGEEVPCAEVWESFKGLAGLGVGAAVAFFVVAILAGIFWLWMLTDSIKRPIEHKPVWILVLLLTGFIGAVIYYFAVKRSAPRAGLPLVPPTSAI